MPITASLGLVDSLCRMLTASAAGQERMQPLQSQLSISERPAHLPGLPPIAPPPSSHLRGPTCCTRDGHTFAHLLLRLAARRHKPPLHRLTSRHLHTRATHHTTLMLGAAGLLRPTLRIGQAVSTCRAVSDHSAATPARWRGGWMRGSLPREAALLQGVHFTRGAASRCLRPHRAQPGALGAGESLCPR